MVTHLEPKAPNSFLLFLAGGMWLGVGVMLNWLAVSWLIELVRATMYWFLTAGLILGVSIHWFGFSRIASKNIARIMVLPQKPCVFAFMSWRSYLLVLVMVSMGIGLRRSPIPKQWLAIIYMGIGTALMLSSVKYFRNILHSKF